MVNKHVLMKSTLTNFDIWLNNASFGISTTRPNWENQCSEGPKGFQNHIVEKFDHESVTMKCDHGKRPFDMGQLCGP